MISLTVRVPKLPIRRDKRTTSTLIKCQNVFSWNHCAWLKNLFNWFIQKKYYCPYFSVKLKTKKLTEEKYAKKFPFDPRWRSTFSPLEDINKTSKNIIYTTFYQAKGFIYWAISSYIRGKKLKLMPLHLHEIFFFIYLCFEV